jgi:NADPH:quinone reductase-like Zn-dependent oxidoreductase
VRCGHAYAQYVTCDVERLAPIPAGLRVTDAAAVPVDTLTADKGIANVLAVGAHRAVEHDDIPGEVVLIVDDDLAATLEV